MNREEIRAPRQVGMIGEVALKTPIIHLVRPAEERYYGGVDVMLKKPVELHVMQEEPDFRQRFPDELFSVVSELRREGVKKINIPLRRGDTANSFTVKTALGMGFYRHGSRLAIDAEKFEQYARERKT